LKSFGDFHKERVFKSGIVGIEFNLDVHCVNRLSEFRRKSTTFFNYLIQATKLGPLTSRTK
jgi:hypothetical protein